MHVPLYGHILFIVSIALSSIAIWQLGIHKGRVKYQISKLLLITLVSILLWIIFLHIVLLLKENPDYDVLGAIFELIGNFIILTGVFFLAIFSKLLTQNKIPTISLGIYLVLMGIIIGLRIAIVYLLSMEMYEFENSINIVNAVFNMICLLYFIYLVQGDLNILLDQQLTELQEKQVKYLYIAIYVGVLSMIPVNFLSAIFSFEYMTIGYVIVSISMGFMVFSYLDEPRVIFLIPDRANLLLVINSAGTLKYYHSFDGEFDEKSDNYLISSALSAIRSVMSDFYKYDVEPRAIELEDQFIRFRFTEDYYLVVFSSYSSSVLDRSLDIAIETINDHYDDNLSEVMKDGSYLELGEILQGVFYFSFQPQLREIHENVKETINEIV